MHGEYLLLLGACVLITLPLEFVLGARVYRRPLAALLAIGPVVLVFGAWDLLGIHRGHWWYEPARISGIELPGSLPLEELAFFVVIPLCGLLTFEAVRTLLARWSALRTARADDRARDGGRGDA
ncbi:lycopene cyclase domain-containing protein [Brachybacterium huguangmaarense]|uniref:Lycopene cyclase domain-containing protein n=1 Tax=Brachybacterium huguangmaarense TaxID=1652028 RepID=A0ABY6FZH7_9MICO|nr:lycopene cyclase domain-containing protein [Brachybacterium huguangmaarense]UYG15823.1 lycopene cyclase domain-containing protein [Brachybacterium huguangmaarense]